MIKTDNNNFRAKLDLRRYFLSKYQNAPFDVFDSCQGSGLIWNQLKKEYPIRTYWGVDLKPQKGRLKIDSSRILLQPGLNANVIDIDTYGSPFKHYFALLPNIARDTTIFLTIGQLTTGTVGSLGKAAIRGAGLDGLKSLPPAMHVKLADYITFSCLHSARKYGILLTEVVEAISDSRNVRYIGIRATKG